jgi:hypothetical protein
MLKGGKKYDAILGDECKLKQKCGQITLQKDKRARFVT